MTQSKEKMYRKLHWKLKLIIFLEQIYVLQMCHIIKFNITLMYMGIHFFIVLNTSPYITI